MSFFSKIRTAAIATVTLVTMSVAGHASTYLPTGPQNDVAMTDVTNGGWTQVYQGTMNQRVAYDTMFNNLTDWVMIATSLSGSNKFDLLAAIRVSDFNAIATGLNVTELHNGAQWYRNGWSLGFSAAGTLINQNSADINERSGGPTSNQRMSWHTSGGAAATPTSVNGGWRSGINTSLNGATNWNRFVFTATDAQLGLANPSPVPLPAALPMLLIGMAGFGVVARRRSTSKASAA